MFHFGLNTVFYLTQSAAHMHTSLQFGHRSTNQLFSELISCPLRENVKLFPEHSWSDEPYPEGR